MNPHSPSLASPQGVAVHIEQLQRRYGERCVLQDISLQLKAGEVLALLGPSGCGKTTLLKILAGLEQPSGGSVFFGEQRIAGDGLCLAPEQRDLGMVFQDYALWPHMNVQANVAFALQMRGVSRADTVQRVQETLALVGLAGMGERLPSSLSGGQQQRVALARAIVARPRLLLFDEPLSNLDRDLRESLCLEMSQLLRSLGCTAVYVTHDHEEACVMADRVAVMQQGRIQQLASPQALWSAPANAAVADFLKLGALVPAQREAGQWRLAGLELGQGDGLPDANQAQVLVPHAALHWGWQAGSDLLRLQGRVLSQQYRCGQFHTLVQTQWDTPLQLRSTERLAPDCMLELGLDARQLHWFSPQ